MRKFILFLVALLLFSTPVYAKPAIEEEEKTINIEMPAYTVVKADIYDKDLNVIGQKEKYSEVLISEINENADYIKLKDNTYIHKNSITLLRRDILDLKSFEEKKEDYENPVGIRVGTKENSNFDALMHTADDLDSLTKFIKNCYTNEQVAALAMDDADFNEVVKIVKINNMLNNTIFQVKDIEKAKELHEANSSCRIWLLCEYKIRFKELEENLDLFEGVNISGNVLTKENSLKNISKLHDLIGTDGPIKVGVYSYKDENTYLENKIDYLISDKCPENYIKQNIFKKLTPTQKRIADIAQNAGISVPYSNDCARWVMLVLQRAGFDAPYWSGATYWEKYADSSHTMDNIPVGAIVIGTGRNSDTEGRGYYYGHVGLAIGDVDGDGIMDVRDSIGPGLSNVVTSNIYEWVSWQSDSHLGYSNRTPGWVGWVDPIEVL